MNNRIEAVLFDFDGVLMDTESHYTDFWNEMGRRYLHEEAFGPKIKGQSLVRIFDEYFSGREADQVSIEEQLDRFERDMPYDYIPGAQAFLEQLRDNGVPAVVVTSSNAKKMDNVYRAHPEFRSYFRRPNVFFSVCDSLMPNPVKLSSSRTRSTVCRQPVLREHLLSE